MKISRLHYSWVTVILAATILTTQAFVMFARGVFIIPLINQFGWDRGTISGAFSMSMLVSGPMSMLTGKLSDRYGPRILLTIYSFLIVTGLTLLSRITSIWQVYLIWGLFIGLGTSCCFTPIMSTIPKWFLKYRGTAIGLTLVGFGIGGIIWPPLIQVLISTYGWRQAFLIMGIASLIIVFPISQFIRKIPAQLNINPYGQPKLNKNENSINPPNEGMLFNEAVRSSSFWLFGLVLLFFWILVQVVFVHVVPHAIDTGISEMVAASILSIIAAVSLVGRISMGIISSKIGTRWALGGCLILATLSLGCLLIAQEPWMFYLFAIVFGLAYGGFVPLETIITTELFGLKAIGSILGAIFLFATVGAAVGPIVAGILFDTTGTYVITLQICIIINIFAIIIACILLRPTTKRFMI